MSRFFEYFVAVCLLLAAQEKPLFANDYSPKSKSSIDRIQHGRLSHFTWVIVYAYCGGEPVNRVDPSGLYWRFFHSPDLTGKLANDQIDYEWVPETDQIEEPSPEKWALYFQQHEQEIKAAFEANGGELNIYRTYTTGLTDDGSVAYLMGAGGANWIPEDTLIRYNGVWYDAALAAGSNAGGNLSRGSEPIFEPQNEASAGQYVALGLDKLRHSWMNNRGFGALNAVMSQHTIDPVTFEMAGSLLSWVRETVSGRESALGDGLIGAGAIAGSIYAWKKGLPQAVLRRTMKVLGNVFDYLDSAAPRAIPIGAGDEVGRRAMFMEADRVVGAGVRNVSERLIGVPEAPLRRMLSRLRGLTAQGQRGVIEQAQAYGSRAGSTFRGRAPLPTSDLDIFLVSPGFRFLRPDQQSYIRKRLGQIAAEFEEATGFPVEFGGLDNPEKLRSSIQGSPFIDLFE